MDKGQENVMKLKSTWLRRLNYELSNNVALAMEDKRS